MGMFSTLTEVAHIQHYSEFLKNTLHFTNTSVRKSRTTMQFKGQKEPKTLNLCGILYWVLKQFLNFEGRNGIQMKIMHNNRMKTKPTLNDKITSNVQC